MCFCKKVEISDIKSFKFCYSTGCFADAKVVLGLEKKGSVYIASFKDAGVPDEGTKFYTVGKSFAHGVRDILAENGVGKWNGFSKASKNVLDGNDFSLYVTMENGDRLRANGYMKWPKNYAVVKERLASLYTVLED